MARLFLSFLGTSSYEPCRYYLTNKEDAIESKYVQAVLIRFLCRDWTAEDKIVIFTTQDAVQKNWNSSKETPGLESELKDSKLSCQIKNILIPDSKKAENIKEIWEIFQKICDEVQDGDSIIFDITHAFRFLPMLSIIAFIYLKTLKEIRIDGVYYGAFEVLGSLKEVQNMPICERLVPIFDLKPFIELADWSIAVDRFVKAGYSETIAELLQQKVKPLLMKHNKIKDENFEQCKLVQNISNNLNELTKNISVCRTLDITESVNRLQKNIEEYRQLYRQLNSSVIPLPFILLLNKIEKAISAFDTSDEVGNGLASVKWCIDHNLIQQAYTILLETLVTFVIASIKNNVQYENKDRFKLDINIRQLVTAEAAILEQNKERKEKNIKKEKYVEIAETIRNFLLNRKELRRLIFKISQRRNDLNHAGYNEHSTKPKKFYEEIQSLYSQAQHEISK